MMPARRPRAGDYERDTESGLLLPRRRGIAREHPQFMTGPMFFGASRSYLIDAYSANLWTCCSLKKRINGYAGSAVRVRRSSDNTEADIGFTSAGDLDTAALATHVGANSGYVTTFYDQGGGGQNITQATASKQPRIVNAGTYDGKLVWDGTDDAMAGGNSGTPSAFSTFLVGKLRSTASTYVLMEHSTNYTANESCLIYFESSAMHAATHKVSPSLFGVSDFSGVSPNDNVHCYRQDRAQADGAAQNALLINGVLQTRSGSAGESATRPSGNYSAQPWYVGARAGTSFYAPLDVYDILIFEAAKSDADVAALSAILAI